MMATRRMNIFVIVALGAAALVSGATAKADRNVLFVEASGARRSHFVDPDGVAGRRFADGLDAGWLSDPSSLDASESDWLDGWASGTDAFDLLVGSSGAMSGGLPAGSSIEVRRPTRGANDPQANRGNDGTVPAWRTLVLGPSSAPIRVAWNGDRAEASLERVQSGDEPWLSDAKTLRWEEVVELLELNRKENVAFRNLGEPNHPLTRFREAFLRDKRTANLALYCLASARPAAVALHLDLASSYENDVLDLVAPALANELPRDIERLEDASAGMRDAAESRFFAERVHASAGRVYGRLDRTFQSLRAELPRGSLLVIDARGGREPFVYLEVVGEKMSEAQIRAAWAESRSLTSANESRE